MSRRALRSAGVALAGVALVAASSACRGPSAPYDWDPGAAPFAPSLRPAFGARVTDGQLQIWTGSTCRGVTQMTFSLDFGQGTSNQATVVLVAEKPGVTVDRFSFGTWPAGMTVKQALPAGRQWSEATTIQLGIYGAPAWGSTATVADIRAGSASHSADSYYFEKVGWLDPAGVAAQDGKQFLATCTPDPTKG